MKQRVSLIGAVKFIAWLFVPKLAEWKDAKQAKAFAEFLAGLGNNLNHPSRTLRGAISVTLLGLYSLMPVTVQAANTVYFSTSDVGQIKSISQWGVEVAWVDADNMRQSIANMGANNIDLIAGNFYLDEPLQANGDIGPNSKAAIDAQMQVALMAGNKPYVLGPTVGDTDPYYLNGTALQTDRWAALIKTTKQYINTKYDISIAGVMPFNEPDYWTGQGTTQELNTILTTLKNDLSFQNTALIGGSTLDSDYAQAWYDPIAGVATYGSTHVLGGSANSYANFFQHVTASGGIPSAPELHGLGEAIYAAQYGAQQGIWWGAVLRTRGLFVQSSQGNQLGYAENREMTPPRRCIARRMGAYVHSPAVSREWALPRPIAL